MPGEGDVSADVESVALVVVEGTVAGDRGGVADVGGEVSEAAGDGASGGGDLVRIGEVDLGAVGEARGTESHFPSADDGSFDGEREEEIRFADHVVIEEVVDASAEAVAVDHPSAIRNRHAELEFFVAFAVECGESAAARGAEVDQRARGGHQRRGLIEVAVEAAEGPVQTRKSEGCAEARADGVFGESVVAGEVRGAKAGGEGQPAERIELVLQEKCGEAAGGMFGIGEEGRVAVVEDGSEALVIGLVETVFADLQAVAS